MNIRPSNGSFWILVAAAAFLLLLTVKPAYQSWKRDHAPAHHSLWVPGERSPFVVREFATSLHGQMVANGLDTGADEIAVPDSIIQRCPGHELFVRFRDVSWLPPDAEGVYMVLLFDHGRGTQITFVSDGAVDFWP